jgi:hypothetical protein
MADGRQLVRPARRVAVIERGQDRVAVSARLAGRREVVEAGQQLPGKRRVDAVFELKRAQHGEVPQPPPRIGVEAGELAGIEDVRRDRAERPALALALDVPAERAVAGDLHLEGDPLAPAGAVDQRGVGPRLRAR